MKFHINEIHLWLKDKPNRVLKFLPNKVNVITGNSGTGKTSLMTIIDYCLLGSESKLVEEVINENTLWYGLQFTINSKQYFIARKKMEKSILSDEVYFSSTGFIPDMPNSTIGIKELRKIIEQEFSIDSNLRIPYGGRFIQAGQKVSYRYFFLFNTQSSSIILNPNLFFDYDLYDRDKYKEALDRIFELAIGVDTVDNVLIKEKLNETTKEVAKYEKRKKLTDRELNIYNQRILELLTSAQERDLVEKKPFTIDEAVVKLKTLISDYKEDKITTDLSELDDLYKNRRDVVRKLRNLKSFDREYEKYQETLENDLDSLKPIDYINQNYKELLPIPEMNSFMKGLGEELQAIKRALDKKRPFSTNIETEIKAKELELNQLSTRINNYPIQVKDFETSIAKFIFIGELKAKLAFYDREWENEDYALLINQLTEEEEALSKRLQDNSERKVILGELLQERIQRYISNSNAIGEYKSFKAYFSYSKKILQLRAPNASSPSSIGSSSNHMFMHLFLFLGLHEHFIREEIPFIPQFLILDQLSEPYYEDARKVGKEEIEDNNDQSKLTEAFKMLNDFITMVRDDLNDEFQFILLEHAPTSFWDKNQMANFHLVEEFRNGNALIN